MPTRTLSSLASRSRGALEQRLGISVSRARPDKHFYATLAGLRPWSPGDVVFDVGANDGRITLRLHEHLPAPRVYAFEPVSATYAELVRNTAALPDVRCFQQALGAEPGEATIYLDEVPTMSSFSQTWGNPVGSEVVSIGTVDDAMATNGVDFVHFLKIDTEGHELPVLEGARQALADSRVAIIQAEVGLDNVSKELTSLDAVRRFLAPFGYRLYGIYNQSRAKAVPPRSWDDERRRGYRPALLAYCDAVFVAADPVGDAPA